MTSAGAAQGLSFSSAADQSGRGQVYLVFEYAEHDLQGLLSSKLRLELPQLKCIIRQLLVGIKYLHDQGIMHRDIKGSNILVTKEGIVKIADLGLARDFKRVNTKNFTYRVVTRWYRAPELLLAICEYSQSIDIWSVGCFVAEMFLGTPLFMSTSESE